MQSSIEKLILETFNWYYLMYKGWSKGGFTKMEEKSYQKEEKLVPKTNKIGLDNPGPKGVGMQYAGDYCSTLVKKVLRLLQL